MLNKLDIASIKLGFRTSETHIGHSMFIILWYFVACIIDDIHNVNSCHVQPSEPKKDVGKPASVETQSHGFEPQNCLPNLKQFRVKKDKRTRSSTLYRS